MTSAGLDWLDQRTGYRALVHDTLFENVPGGARWRYVWGSTLVFFFSVQVITGLFLWMSYSPSTQTAWESVYDIQHQMWGGWFLRGLHHFVAQAMTILLVLHVLQVVVDGAYKAPREANLWTGVLLLVLVLALSLTGYLLPWDQNGFWATAVSTNIIGIMPGAGDALQTVLVGGSSYGHQTLTRFFALHAGVIPGGIMLFIVGHVYLFRRHGVTPKEPRTRPDRASGRSKCCATPWRVSPCSSPWRSSFSATTVHRSAHRPIPPSNTRPRARNGISSFSFSCSSISLAGANYSAPSCCRRCSISYWSRFPTSGDGNSVIASTSGFVRDADWYGAAVLVGRR